MKKITLILIIMFLLMVSLYPSESKKKVYVTKPINPHPPVIDGKLDDPIWQNLKWGGDFTQREPKEGVPPTQQTAFKITYDNNNLYVGIRAYDTEPDKISRIMCRRDYFDGDWVEINIDSYHDLRTAFSFSVNAAGVKGDEAISNDGGNWDKSWDPIWYVKTHVDSKGWTAEMKIPFSQLRFANKKEHVWGLQFMRRLYRKNERSIWQFIPKKSAGYVHRFGELRGIMGIQPKRMVQLLPYSVGKLQTFEKEEGNPFSTGRSNNLMGGLDGKIGITNDLTLDFTVNPDFGQVEADPSEVNLTAFESYFDEKRPFFIEGRNILNFKITSGGNPYASDNLFYTRRIGRIPQHEPDLEDHEYMNFPDATTIIGALKLTGKTRKGLSIGILESVTAREHAEIDNLGDRRNQTVEPFTNYFVFRLQKDINQGKTIFGGMFTATNRSINDDHLDYLHKAAYTGGFDISHTWKKKTYYLSLNTVFSLVRGSKEAIYETQTSSRRYFQRPDATHVKLDPDRTSLSGHGGTFSIGKQGGKHWRYSTGITWRSPGLELNDAGYLRRADESMQWLWAQYRITDPFSIFNAVHLNFNQWTGWNFGGDSLYKGANINFYTQFKNQWGFGSGINVNLNELSHSLLRGGPSIKMPGGWSIWYNIHSNNTKKLNFSLGGSHYRGREKNGQSNHFWCGATFKPINALSIGIHPSYNTRNNQLQYIDTLNMGEEDRYLFGRIDQKTLAMTIRINLSLAPNLSIQFYGQPFVSAGDYSELKRITSPHHANYKQRFEVFSTNQFTLDPIEETYRIDENVDGLMDYSFDNPDFNFLQFRSNLVVRWEYKPGSTVYLVWSQGRTDDSSIGRFSYFRDLENLFNTHPHNVFLIKFSYSFNR